MPKNVLVTLADENYLDQAKQLFSSVYFNAGWKGDYLLIAHKIKQEELQWFKDRGITIKECDLIVSDHAHNSYPPVVYCKAILFKTDFKKWHHVIYLDADIIVRGSLDHLLTLKTSFHAVADMSSFKDQSIDQSIRLSGKAFCSGIMSFKTGIIKNDAFEKIQQLCRKYQKISTTGEQLALNVYFYKKWKELPVVYGMFIYEQANAYRIQSKHLKAIILHFASKEKPWQSHHAFYSEWVENFKRAESIDLTKTQRGQAWSKATIMCTMIYLNYRYVVYNVLDKYLGLCGIFARKLIQTKSA